MGRSSLLGQVLFAIGFLLWHSSAHAGNCGAVGATCSFTPIKPSSSCGTYATPGYTFVASSVPWDWDLPDLNDPPDNGGPTSPSYANALLHATQFVGNGWTYRVRLHFSRFWVDPTDAVRFGGVAYTGLDQLPFHAIWSAPTSPSTSSIHSQGPAMMSFTSDRSETSSTGFLIDELGVCKRSAQTTVDTAMPVLMDSAYRFTGALLGTNDVVYLRVPPSVAGARWTYALWSEHSPFDSNVDFDIYARCGAWPTPTAYSHRSFSGNTREFINASACTAGTYLAIHSFKGSGVFHVTWGKHFPSSERIVKAGTNFNANVTDIQAMESALQAAARRLYGQTEGNWMMTEIWLYNSNNCSNCGGAACDLCMRSETGRSYCDGCGQQSTIYRDDWEPYTIAHEWGHQYLCVGDEYFKPPVGPEASQCGHSNMGSSGLGFQGNNNFCNDMNHNMDRGDDVGPTSLPDVRSAGQGMFVNGGVTYDNFSYHDHDFELQVGKVVRK
jgi:hypothetical protein